MWGEEGEEGLSATATDTRITRIWKAYKKGDMFYQPLYGSHRLSINTTMAAYARRIWIWTGLAMLVGTEVRSTFGARISAPLPPDKMMHNNLCSGGLKFNSVLLFCRSPSFVHVLIW